MTVAENVALGLPNQGMRLNLGKLADRLSELSDEYEFDIDPHQEIWKLPIGMRQRVEILKVLFRDADIVILDEPTSVLAPNEISSFLDGLRRLRDTGKTVIFITHKLDEVEVVADNVTIMRHGAGQRGDQGRRVKCSGNGATDGGSGGGSQSHGPRRQKAGRCHLQS